MEHDRQQQVAIQSPPLLPSIPSLSRTFPRNIIAPINEQMPPNPRMSANPMYFSNPSEPIFSAMNMFPTQGQQQPRQPGKHKCFRLRYLSTSDENQIYFNAKFDPLFLQV